MIGDVGNMTMLLVCGNGITDEYRQPTCKLVKTRFSPESPPNYGQDARPQSGSVGCTHLAGNFFWLVHSIVSQCG